MTRSLFVAAALSFLGAGQYRATLVRDDAPDGSTIKVEESTHSRTDVITLELRAGGGMLGRFSLGTPR